MANEKPDKTLDKRVDDLYDQIGEKPPIEYPAGFKPDCNITYDGKAGKAKLDIGALSKIMADIAAKMGENPRIFAMSIELVKVEVPLTNTIWISPDIAEAIEEHMIAAKEKQKAEPAGPGDESIKKRKVKTIMSTITMKVGLPRVISGEVEKFEAVITKDPADHLEAESKLTLSGDATDFEIEGSEGVHVGISIVAINAAGQRSKAVTKNVQLAGSLAPEISDEISCSCSADPASDDAETGTDEDTGTDENTGTDEDTGTGEGSEE